MKTLLNKCSCILYLTIILFACNDSDNNEPEIIQLPPESYKFIDKHFPDINIISATDTKTTPKYNVMLDGNILVQFEEDGYWHSVESKHDLPTSIMELIDEKTQEQLAIKEPGRKIRKIYKYYGSESIFQLDNGNVYMDCYGWYGKGLATLLADGVVPKAITDFLKQNNLSLNDKMVSYLKTNREELYRVDLDLFSQIWFDKDGKWIGAHDYHTPTIGFIKNIVENELPAATAATIKNFNKKVLSIYNYHNGWYGVSITENLFLVNSLGEIANAPTKRANELAEKYFEVKPKKEEEQWATLYSFGFEYQYSSKSDYTILHLNMDLKDWTSVYFLIQKFTYRELPMEFIKGELPDAISKYLEQNNLTKVYTVSRNKEYYALNMANKNQQDYLYFDLEGNLISLN